MDRFGISAALLTPFTRDGPVDFELLVRHARAVLKNGAASVTLFGTTGEGASLSPSERRDGLQHLLSAGIPPGSILQTVSATSVDEAAAQTADGFALGISRFLLVPPFYFKDCRNDGLFEWHTQLFARTDPKIRFVLYHIPQVSGIALAPQLVGRLAANFPDRLLAVKDSSGSWETASEFLALKSVPVLIGDERLLHRAIAQGGAGAITGMANLYPERLRRIFETAAEDPALTAEVTRIVRQPVIPTLKALLARQSGEAGWETLRAPLQPLSANERRAVGL